MLRTKTFAIGLVVASLLTVVVFAQQAGERIEKGVTAPSSRRELAFSFQGIIGKVNVTEGDVIKVGDALLIQDERIEKSRLDAMRLESDRTLVIKAKEAALDNKKVELKRKKDLFERQAMSESEYLQGQLDVVLAQAEVEVSKHEQTTKQAELTAQETRLKLLTLFSPIEGIVERVVQKEGEVANIDKPSIIVVKNDPLYIDVKTLPVAVVQTLKKGQELEVRYDGGEWQKGKINFIAPVADARANQQSIRLEMPNPENRSTGLMVDVKIPSSAQTAAR